MNPKVAVLDYGIGNLGSAHKAFVAIGADARLVQTPNQVEGADALVLPGVGSFGACITAFEEAGFAAVVREAIAAEVPFLGICVGMQMLYEGSEEDPDHQGLGILPGRVTALRGKVKVPQMQWNRLDTQDHPMWAGCEVPWVYFVHSYAAPSGEMVIATCDYGAAVTAAIARGRLWATQFHPEKSAATGLRMLANFVQSAER